MARRISSTDNVSFASQSRFNTTGWNSVFVWFRDHNNSVDDVLFTGRVTSMFASDGFVLARGGPLGGSTAKVYAGVAGTYSGAGTAGVGDGGWHNAGLMFDVAASANAEVWVNGSQDKTFVHGALTWGSVPITIGFLTGGGSGDRTVAEVAWWNTNLNAREWSALNKGVHPSRIRPESLIFLSPCWGLHSPEIELSSSHAPTGTVTGTSVVNGPPVTLFTPKRTIAYIADNALPYTRLERGIRGMNRGMNAGGYR